MGQILSDEGDQDEAINCLIDSLRWNSKNANALLMMGNIFAKHQKDIVTALKYYDQALVDNPNDSLGITNIGYLLFQEGKCEEAKKYAREALKVNPEYPNAYFLLALVADEEQDFEAVFDYSLQAIRCNKNQDILYKNSVYQVFDAAHKIVAKSDGKSIFSEYRHRLELDGGTAIAIVEATDIPTAAKIEFAENYNRNQHLVRYKPNYPAVAHLIVHEMVHLDLVIQARKAGLNQLFVASAENKNAFKKFVAPTIAKLQGMGVEEAAIANFCKGLLDGLNLQAYNTPIDLFIEDFLYHEFVALRPYQFLSVYTLIQEGVKAVNDERIIELVPAAILSKTRIYNLVNALQFQSLYGLDVTNDFKATAAELRKAAEFYTEFLEYKDSRKPGEEYELVQHWAEDLQIDAYFKLENENQYRKRSDVDSFITHLEQDPFGLEADEDPLQQKEMQEFLQQQEAMGLNKAVVLFMVSALGYFKDKPTEKIKEIAFEIAMLGAQGIDPNTKNYILSSFPDKRFSGYQVLAYYYVSWRLAMPDQVDKLGLDYGKEFLLARTITSG